MKAWHFSENAYPYLPPADEYESIRVSLPNRLYDPVKGHDTSELYSRGVKPKPVLVAKAGPKPKFVPPPPPPPPAVVAAPVVVPDEIIMIRGREKTVELIGSKEAKKQRTQRREERK